MRVLDAKLVLYIPLAILLLKAGDGMVLRLALEAQRLYLRPETRCEA